MNQGIKRSILRWIHIVFGIPILGYIYSPFEEIPKKAKGKSEELYPDGGLEVPTFAFC
jgi:hypothetical protein